MRPARNARQEAPTGPDRPRRRRPEALAIVFVFRTLGCGRLGAELARAVRVATLEPAFPMTAPLQRPARSRITPDDLRCIALTLVDRHGARALGYADQAVAEMEAKGEAYRADAWRALRSEVEDALSGRIEPGAAIILH